MSTRQKQILLSLLPLLILSNNALGQERWQLSGQIRQRFEMDNKDFNGNTDSNNFNLLRSRINAEFAPSDNLSAFFQMQDSRRFGEETSTLVDGSADNFDVHQAYFNLENVFNLPVDLKVGRMEVVLGPQRLVGAVGWHNVGRSFDGARIKIHSKKVSVDVFNFKEVENSDFGDTGDRSVLGAYSDFKIAKSHKAQGFIIWQKETPSDNRSCYTLGAYSKGNINQFHHETELAFQGGKRAGADVSAFMAALNVGYTFAKSSITPDVTIGVDYLSGDDNPDDNTFKVFDTLYATNHKYYGFMDFFLNIPVHTVNLGLRDTHVKLSSKPFTKTKVALAFHRFNANANYTLVNGSNSKGFGSEIDLTVSHKYSQNVTFTGGASLFTPGEIFKETRGGDSSNWVFLQTVVNL